MWSLEQFVDNIATDIPMFTDEKTEAKWFVQG